jgi:hypothetical protein
MLEKIRNCKILLFRRSPQRLRLNSLIIFETYRKHFFMVDWLNYSRGMSMPSTEGKSRDTYEIRVKGTLDQGWEEWFNGVFVDSNPGSGQPPLTTLTVIVADQAALRGVLGKLWDLNLILISVRCIELDDKDEGGK